MSKARDLLNLVSQSDTFEATMTESVISTFSEAQIQHDVLSLLLEDIAHSSRSNIKVDIRNDKLIVELQHSKASDKINGLCDTQKLFEDVGFHIEELSESESSIELTLRV